MQDMTVVVEDASIRDLDRLCEIEAECFKEEAFTRTQMAQLLKDYNSISLVARVEHAIVGFVIGAIYVDRKALHAHIATIEVLPACRRRGIGQKLLEGIETIFRQKGVKTSALEVREDNVPAIALYRKLGYQTIGKLANYYGGVHGIYLRKVLA
jgi:ribosomal-protein-alanine N-acetyltransferase